MIALGSDWMIYRDALYITSYIDVIRFLHLFTLTQTWTCSRTYKLIIWRLEGIIGFQSIVRPLCW